jgi:hypothetical protein
MRVCSKCGLPNSSSSVCTNCGSTSFKVIGNQNNQNSQNIQNQVGNHYANNYQNGYQNNYPNYQQNQMGYNGNGYVPVNAKPVVGVVPPQNVNGMAGVAAASVAVGAAKQRNQTRIIILILLAILVLIGGIVAAVVVSSSGPEDTIEDLETAFNNKDMNGIIDCFDSTTRDAYSAGSDLMDGVLGFGYESLFDVMPFVYSLTGEEWPTYDIEVLSKTKTSSKECTVHVRWSETYDGDTESEEMDIKMVKEDGKWYISSDEILSDL